MPKILRHNLLRAVLDHLTLRMMEREFNADQIVLFGRWCDTDPEVPRGTWFKRFPGLIVCGEGELVKTFLLPGQAPHGQEVS